MKSKMKTAFSEYRDILLISLICVPIGAIIGAIDALFGRVLLAITAFRGLHPLQLIPFLFLGGAFVAFYYMKFGKGSEKGMGLVFDAAHGREDNIPLRLVPFIMVGTWITHLFGGSAGREGVAVQIGGTLSFWIGKRVPIKNGAKVFLVAGMAAGFAGLFQTPIAAVMFAMEVLVAGAVIYRAFVPALVGAFTASAVSSLLGLEKFTFVISGSPEMSIPIFIKLVVLGIIFGIVGGGFAGALKWTKGKFGQLIKNPVVRIAVGGVIVSILLLVLHMGRYAGLGTNLISDSVNGREIFAYDWILKYVLTVVTLSLGFQGGEVTPLFSIGASLGAVLAMLFGFPVELTAALGYAAVFGSASNTFFAPVFIGAEVFGVDYIPYFFIVCAFAYICNGNLSIYGKQKLLKRHMFME